MLKLSQICLSPIRPGAADQNINILQDFLEMRADLPEKKRRCLLEQLGHLLDLSGEIQTLPAFMVGAQAVLCIKDDTPETYWVNNPKMECLRPWKENSLTPKVPLG